MPRAGTRPMAEFQVVKAVLSDARDIQALIRYWAAKDLMLPRALGLIYENIRDFYVIRDEQGLAGCAALHISWEDLAEVKSVAIREDRKGQGLGTVLVNACLDEARSLGLPRVFALTYQVSFFERLGFSRIDRSSLPHKVWQDCINCTHFPDCDEEAVEMRFDKQAPAF